MKTLTSVVALFALGLGCASSPPPAPAAPSDAKAGAAMTAVKPDTAKAASHIKNHVKYPATRAELLAACAGTAEFTSQEKKWFADNLAEGTYKSPDDVMKALKL